MKKNAVRACLVSITGLVLCFVAGLIVDPAPAAADPLPSPAFLSSSVEPSAQRHVSIPEISHSIKVDAVLDEEAWASALVMDLPYETYPGDNIPARVETEFLMMHDEHFFYAAFRAFDPDPDLIRAHLSDRDAAFEDDFVGILLDTFNDERRAYEFFVNPLGVQMDLIEDDVSLSEDASWDAIWKSAGRLTPDGYVVELAIPFRQLRFRPTDGEQTWGIDVIRIWPRDDNFIYRIQPRDMNISCHICQISKVTGFKGVSPGRNIQLTPTLTATRTDRREDFPDGGFTAETQELDPGFTGRWGMTSNLTLTGTINPDFSQVEADVAQLDVNTTFALFYPEKRPFFLEDADYFDTPISTVYTRTMADPLWGAKFSGKASGNAFGAYLVEDEITNLIFPGNQGSDFFSLDESHHAGIFRYRRDVGDTSAIGALVTGRSGDEYGNLVYGADGLLRFSEADSVTFQVLRSETEYPDEIAGEFGQPLDTFDDMAMAFKYRHSTRNWWWRAQYRDLGSDFRADSGFLPKVDYRLGDVGLERTWWGNEDSWWSNMAFGGFWFYEEDQSGRFLGDEVEFWAKLHGPRQSLVRFEAEWGEKTYNEVDFNLAAQELHVHFWPWGDLFLGLDIDFGDQIDYANTRNGDLFRVNPEVTYRFGRHLRIGLDHSFERLDVEGNEILERQRQRAGRLYDANLTQLRTVYQFNIRTFVRLISQYAVIDRDPNLYLEEVESETRQLFNQFLFSFKINPQTVFFLGYSDNFEGYTTYQQGIDTVDLTRADWTVFAKVGYAWSK